MRWGCLALVLMLGCGDDGTSDPDGGMDAGTDGGTDVGAVDTGADTSEPDAGDDAGTDAGADAGGDAGVVSCGWSAADSTYECFATDDPPDTVVCDGDECCTPNECTTDEAQVCCNMVTGELRTVFYAGGTCEESTDPCED